MVKKLYKDCQLDYEKNLELYLTGDDIEKKKALDAIFIDFKTYCFNKIRKMRSFLPIEVINDWSTDITLNAFRAISNKGLDNRESWPVNMGAYLAMFCLDINRKEKYSPEAVEVDYETYSNERNNEEEGEKLLEINDKLLDEETGKWLVTEAVKMTIINDGYTMVDIDRAMKLATKYNNKVGKFSDKNKKVLDALTKNVETLLAMEKK